MVRNDTYLKQILGKQQATYDMKDVHSRFLEAVMQNLHSRFLEVVMYHTGANEVMKRSVWVQIVVMYYTPANFSELECVPIT